ncbi:MAG: winged helix-turn-helix transcriptional regulator [Rhizobiales bacterium]|nr:winged helix-turn-helix transcriptional regulator [Hyphomicrobiales bacterium]
MVTTVSIAEVGALVGDPTRAAMLQALMDGRALTASELASVAGITPQTASGHLAQLAGAGLVAVAKQGRHRYHHLATSDVARMLESLMLVAAASPVRRVKTGPRDQELRRARTCYDHIAGWLGVALADAMVEQNWVEMDEDAALVTMGGVENLTMVGIDLLPAAGRRGRSVPFCRLCLDWSERRPHFAGRLGKALCDHGLKNGWIRKRDGSRVLDISPEGRRQYRKLFCVEIPDV